MKPPTKAFALRPYLPRDAREIANLFRDSIEELASDDYSAAQREAWAAAADDEARFSARLGALATLVALSQDRIAGFAALKGADTLVFLYTHPDFAGQGVATFLCAAVETLARGRKAEALNVEASDSAQRFFARRGFVGLRRNSVSLGEEWLANTTMRKPL